MTSKHVGPLEAFDLWWREHESRGQLNGVDRADVQMVWVEAQRELLAEVHQLQIDLQRTTLSARYLDEGATKLLKHHTAGETVLPGILRCRVCGETWPS